ncbi:MAG: mandelate racemase/muconate lactonizing enzyme family protein [Chloroflexota bacterium]
MKIAEVETIVLRQPEIDDAIADGSQDDLIVRITTDDGIVGIGEVDSAPEVIQAAIDAPNSHANAIGLRHMLLGADPLDTEALWARMYRGSVYYGRRGVAIHAMSGVDLALWDIKGKVAGKPVCELLGTVRQTRIRAYASTLMPDTEDEVRVKVAGLAEMGFTAIKLGWGPLGKDERHDVRLVKAARQTVGDGVDIMIDAGLGYVADAKRAIWVAQELEQLGVYWLEEPFEPDELDAYAELADTVDLKIAAGEHDSTAWSFRELIDGGHLDVVQPDMTRCGGLTEARKIAKLAEERGVICMPHAWKSGIVKAASLHMNAILPGERLQEYCVAGTPINEALTVQRHPLKDGYVDVPTAPGLGVDLDPEIVARFAVSTSR